MDFRLRLDDYYLLGHRQRRINMAPCAAAGEVETSAIRFQALPHCHQARVCLKPACNASLLFMLAAEYCVLSEKGTCSE
jgi:hypothetical protein